MDSDNEDREIVCGLTGNHEIYSQQRGWIRIKEIKSSDKILCTDNQNILFKPVTHAQKFNYRGPIYCLDDLNIELECTEHNTLLVSDGRQTVSRIIDRSLNKSNTIIKNIENGVSFKNVDRKNVKIIMTDKTNTYNETLIIDVDDFIYLVITCLKDTIEYDEEYDNNKKK